MDPYCEGCYYCGSAGGLHTCDYIFIADRRRPCPGGAGCTVRITRKEMLMNTPSWDADAGYKMWLDGSSDKEISNALHIAVSTVSYRRRKYWEKIPQAGGRQLPPRLPLWERRTSLCLLLKQWLRRHRSRSVCLKQWSAPLMVWWASTQFVQLTPSAACGDGKTSMICRLRERVSII